ncbi:MAG TPA: hypothetical protein VMU89_07990 [Thermomicrobiaceae bacterium]|nr:hypothetical protein [Thermomicrobiaceae bacterium]
MTYTVQQAYDAIKRLEADGQLILPEPVATVLVGTFDAAARTFHYAIPTGFVTMSEPPVGGTGPVGKPVPPVRIRVGVVTANAVDLLLQFQVVNPQGPLAVTVEGFSPVSAAPGQTSVTVDVGRWTSTVSEGQTSLLTVSLHSGTASSATVLEVVRPPVIGAGAFTVPALPIALVYAPPPGTQNKNYAEYASLAATSTKIATTVTSSNVSKTATAYTTQDYVGKISGLVTSLISFGSSFGGTGDTAKGWSTGIAAGLNVLAGVLNDTSTSDSSTLTTTAEHDLVTTDTNTGTFGTPVGLGPGVGDRFVYLRNVRFVWLVADGEIGFTVLGDDGIRAFAAQELAADLRALTPPSTLSAGPTTNLDAATLQMLLALDPLVGNPGATLSPPRFAQNDPASAGGSGSDPSGDTFSVSHEVTATDIDTQVNIATNITDYKPGWLNSLFGGTHATEHQLTTTYASSSQVSIDQKVTATVHFYAAPTDPPYLVGLYVDRLFRTFVFTPWTAGQARPGPGPA